MKVFKPQTEVILETKDEVLHVPISLDSRYLIHYSVLEKLKDLMIVNEMLYSSIYKAHKGNVASIDSKVLFKIREEYNAYRKI